MPESTSINLSSVRIQSVRDAVFAGQKFTGKDWSEPSDSKAFAMPLHLAKGVRLKLNDLNTDEIILIQMASDRSDLQPKEGYLDAVVNVCQKSDLRIASEELAVRAIDRIVESDKPVKMLAAIPEGALSSAGILADHFRRVFVDIFDGDERHRLVSKIETTYQALRAPELESLAQQLDNERPDNVRKVSGMRR